MAYQPPPQKSPYGDELLDDNQPQSSALPRQSYNRQGEPSRGPVYGAGPIQSSSTEPPAKANSKPPFFAPDSITPEDIVFMRDWQRDSYFRRVLPISILSWTSLYTYNRIYQKPHKFGRYLLITGLAYVIGKYSYASEFKRRIAESKSNTPYMQALRKQIGLNPVTGDNSFRGDTDASQDFGHAAGNDSTNWNSAGLVGDMNLGTTGAPSQSLYRQPNYDPNSQPSDSENPSETVKRDISYEELRARNRGLIR